MVAGKSVRMSWGFCHFSTYTICSSHTALCSFLWERQLPLASESSHVLFLPPENPFPPVHVLPFPSARPWCSVGATTQTCPTEHKSEPWQWKPLIYLTILTTAVKYAVTAVCFWVKSICVGDWECGLWYHKTPHSIPSSAPHPPGQMTPILHDEILLAAKWDNNGTHCLGLFCILIISTCRMCSPLAGI